MTQEVIHEIATTALCAAGVFVVARQCRRPARGLGRLFLWNMNARHAGVTHWGLSHVSIEKEFVILDVGCGGGKTIETLARNATNGRVHGIDYSKESVAIARKTNARSIEAGRVEIEHGSVSKLPFEPNAFDLVTAIETHYYWPDLARDLREILRVLKPGGKLALIAETYKGRSFDWVYRPAMMLLGATYLDVDGHRASLTQAGFIDVEVDVDRARGWICAVGKKAR